MTLIERKLGQLRTLARRNGLTVPGMGVVVYGGGGGCGGWCCMVLLYGVVVWCCMWEYGIVW